MGLERLLLYGFLLVVLLSPLPFGAVEPWSSSLLAASCLVLGGVWAAWRSRSGRPSLPWRDPVLLAGALLVGLGLLQMTPLPRPILRLVSPGTVALRDAYEPGPATAPPAATAAPSSAARPAASTWRPISLYPWATRQSTLRLVACLLAILITLDLAARDRSRRILVMGLALGGGFQAIYGLAEYFSDRQQIFGYVKKYYTDVATGTFINRNHYAGYLEMTLPLAIALAVAALRARPHRTAAGADPAATTERDRRFFVAGLLLVLALAMATALVCSRSRMGIASALAALLTVGVALAWRGRGRGFAAAAVLVGLVTAAIFVQGDATMPLVERFRSAFDDLGGDLGRWQIWQQAGRVIAAFPVAGAGLGTFAHVFPAFRTTGAGIGLTHAHSDYVETAAETGVAGCLLLLAGLFLIVRPLWRRRAGRPGEEHLGYAALVGVVAIAFHSITDFNLAIPSNALTLAVLAGLTIAWLRPAAPILAAVTTPSGSGRTRAWAAPAALFGIALLAVAPAAAAGSGLGAGPPADAELSDPAWQATGLGHWIDGDNAERLFETARGAALAAIADLRALIELRSNGGQVAPETATYVARRLQRAIEVQTAGLRLLPLSAQGHLMLGEMIAGHCAATLLAGREGGGCLDAAMPELRAALRLSPVSASTHAQVARFLADTWPLLDGAQRAEALRILQRAVDYNPMDNELRARWIALLDAAPGSAS
jgi:O-antigen ligase